MIPFIGLTLILYLLITETIPQAISSTLVMPLIALCGALQLCEFYRQRFYLDPSNERGLRWRAFLLKLAKWPYFLLAIYDAFSGRAVPDVITRKFKAETGPFMLFWPHLSVAITVLVAWTIRILSGSALHPIGHVGAAIVIIGSLMLALAERFDLAHCYSKNAFARKQERVADLEFEDQHNR